VFYIQYAHARVCSVKRKALSEGSDWTPEAGLDHLDTLTTSEELALALLLAQFPEVVASAAQRLEPHDIANYLRELAAAFHGLYNAHKLIDEDNKNQSLGRISLAEATRQVIANGLDLLGVSAPESM
jgi:arginyl-tRNA synthetase